MNRRFAALTILLPGLGLFALATGAFDEARVTGELRVREPAQRGDTGVFGYAGDIGAGRWANLRSRVGQDNSICELGLAQSPIDFDRTVVREGDEDGISVSYSPAEFRVENLGTTIKFPYSNASHMQIGSNRYELVQFHFHTPSEHTVDGAGYPLEIHLVHKLSDTQFAVLGVMVKEGRANAAFPEFGDRLELDQIIPRNENVSFEFASLHIDATKLLPTNRSFYRYEGSLTTPPCSEVVLWSVFAQPIEMSRSQIRVLREALGDLRFAGPYGGNNRPTQPLNDRKVTINH